MTEKILVLGCSGQVGNELVRFICPGDFIIIGLSHADADITKKNDISNIIKNSGCSLVINAAAFTEVDIAEKKRNLAYKINEKGTYNVGEACRNAGIPLIHISTDYVFDGNKKTGFIEDDLVNPLGAYGASKNAGEFALREVLKEHIILRTSWVYSSTGKNFVKTILRLGNEREEISVVDDQYGCPTSAHEIAQVIIEMACQIIFNGKKDKWGTYHYCGDTKMTWYGFACEIFNVVSKLNGCSVPKIIPITTNQYPTAARRPQNSVLNCLRINQVYRIQQKPFIFNLSQVLKELITIDAPEKR
ncbi:MAG: dTDP-4-dehydrorhamnose reductase [Alphaproteobacteria bacterium]